MTYQMCKRCVMDTSDDDIFFDSEGICNHCKDFEKTISSPKLDKKTVSQQLKLLIEKVKSKGENKKYDCLVGISGGVDSCYTAYLCKKWGLKPLLIHMDNGWNSEIAVKNVKKIVDKLLI